MLSYIVLLYFCIVICSVICWACCPSLDLKLTVWYIEFMFDPWHYVFIFMFPLKGRHLRSLGYRLILAKKTCTSTIRKHSFFCIKCFKGLFIPFTMWKFSCIFWMMTEKGTVSTYKLTYKLLYFVKFYGIEE